VALSLNRSEPLSHTAQFGLHRLVAQLNLPNLLKKVQNWSLWRRGSPLGLAAAVPVHYRKNVLAMLILEYLTAELQRDLYMLARKQAVDIS
jgi:hypothetical protein